MTPTVAHPPVHVSSNQPPPQLFIGGISSGSLDLRTETILGRLETRLLDEVNAVPIPIRKAGDPLLEHLTSRPPDINRECLQAGLFPLSAQHLGTRQSFLHGLTFSARLPVDRVVVGLVSTFVFDQFETDRKRLDVVVERLVKVEGIQGTSKQIPGRCLIRDLVFGQTTSDPSRQGEKRFLSDVDTPLVAEEMDRGVPRPNVENLRKLLIVT